MSEPLSVGLYDQELTKTLKKRIEESGLSATTEQLESEISKEVLSNFFSRRLFELLDNISGDKREKTIAQVEFINSLVEHVKRSTDYSAEFEDLCTPPEILKALQNTTELLEQPAVGLSQPWIFTAGKDSPGLLRELIAELSSCNQVDILVSFITVSGVRKIIDILRLITSTDANGKSQTKIRILTTTYIGATEQKALDMLARLANCEVRVSLDGRRTRLHAKAWIFSRDTDFGSVYVGSANLSGAALMGGLEWTVKFTENKQPLLFDRAKAHFETLWEDNEFESYDPDNELHRSALATAIKKESGQATIDSGFTTFFDIKAKPFQQEILDQLDSERKQGRMRNLLIAATGTGKTVMAALDYRRIANAIGGQPRLLFVVHRKEILRQAIQTFRQVLKDSEFGDLLFSGQQPSQHNHLFTTVRSLSSREIIERFGADYWHMVIIDECHHMAANSYRDLVDSVEPNLLLGLTATPERNDGQSILADFDSRPDGSPSVQLRLWTALDLQLLTPFEYYACDDDTDYSSIPWSQSGEISALDNLLTGNDIRARAVINAWSEMVESPQACRTLVFCVSIAHAKFMVEKFNQAGIISKLVSAETPDPERNRVRQELVSGDIHAVVTVDLYNEGVDLPIVDTLLLLRPTQSVTLFQQQIGRGLRLYEGKTSCLILDFVGQHKMGFRFDLLFSSITGLSRSEVEESIKEGFSKLPSGCHIQLQKKARENILSSLRDVLTQNWRTLQRELTRYVGLTGNRNVELAGFLNDQKLELTDIYKSGKNSGWTNLLRDSNLITGVETEHERYLSRRLTSLLHIDDIEMLQLYSKVGEKNGRYAVSKPTDETILQMLAYQIDGQHHQSGTWKEFLKNMSDNTAVCNEMFQLCNYLISRVNKFHQELPGLENTGLKLHSAYEIRQILTAVGFLTSERRTPFQAGVLALPEIKTELLFVTLDKTTAIHQGVAYNDYAISNELFHWQSQNSASPNTKAGERYINGAKIGWSFQLFVRIDKNNSYRACGPVEFLSYRGSKPMNITWKIKHPLPVNMFREFSVISNIG